MKNKIIILFALLVLLSSLSFAQVEKPKEVRKAEELSLSKIVEMSKAGLGEETIINAIINSNQSFVLTVKEILYLKEAGVSEEIINFMLRSRPVETAPVAQEVEAQEPGEPKEPLPEYVADAAEGNYYDGYEYTDGYNFQDDRGSTIAYHYYGPWFRAYPYYYGFYYYPMSHYYYHYYPDDYYYYFYYPHFSSWRWYYNYPHYYRSHYYYGSGGRFVRSPGGRYSGRYGGNKRYAVKRGAVRSRNSAVSSRNVRDTRNRNYSGSSTGKVRSRSAITRSRSSSPTNRTRSTITRSRKSYPSTTIRRSRPTTSSRYSSPTRSNRTSRTRISRPGTSTRSRGSSTISRPSTSSRSRSKASTVRSRSSSGSSRSYSRPSSSGSRSSGSRSSGASRSSGSSRSSRSRGK